MTRSKPKHREVTYTMREIAKAWDESARDIYGVKMPPHWQDFISALRAQRKKRKVRK